MKHRLVRTLLFLFFVGLLNSARSSNYYFSSVSGNDSRTTAQAQNRATPWQTLSKLNSLISSLNAGDSVLFKCGETFYGSITVTKSGTTTRPIVFASYGTGSRPVISGLQTLSNWVSIGNGIYESYNASFGSTINTVIFNGAMQAMGRYPNPSAANKGYLTFESHNGNSITDQQLTSGTNWTGAEVVIRPKRWVLDRCKITSHSGNTLSFTPALTYNPYDNYGYFIQNHIKTLDQLGEWYYNPATKKLNVYFGSANPSSYSVQASATSTLVTVNNQNNIVFYNIGFNGSNTKAFDLYYAQNITIQSCSVMYSGIDGIDASATTNLWVRTTYFNYTNNNAIDLNYNCNNSVLRYNYIANTGMTAGMGLSGTTTYQAVTIVGNNNLVEYNTIFNTGCIGIRFGMGDSNVIKNNFINYFTMTKDDAGGIYTWAPKNSNYSSQKIIGNIVLNGIGAPEGTDRPGTGSSNGIYLDDNCTNIDIVSNSVANCGRSGILVHNSFNTNVLNNILFNNLTQLTLIHDYGMPNALLRNMVVKNNICFAKVDSQYASYVRTEANDINLLGVMDSNYFCRPMDDNLTMSSSLMVNGLRVDRVQDLAGWQSTYGLDKSSKKTPLLIPQYTVNSFAGANKFSNGTFNSNITGAYAAPTCSWVNNKLDGGTFQATNQYSDFSNYAVIVGVGAVSSSKSYILRFSSMSSKDTLINAYLRISGPPYSCISDVKVIAIKTGRQENEYLFTAPTSCSNASIIFTTRCPKLNFWLDNIELYDANVAQTDPDSYVFYQYNNTTTSKTFSLSGTYLDVYGKVYTNSVTIPAYSSVVLIKQTTANLLYSFNDSKIGLKEIDLALPSLP